MGHVEPCEELNSNIRWVPSKWMKFSWFFLCKKLVCISLMSLCQFVKHVVWSCKAMPCDYSTCHEKHKWPQSESWNRVIFQGWRRHDCGYKCEASLPTPGVGSWKGHTWANTANPPIMVAFKLMGWYQFPVCGLWPAGQHCTSLNISGCLNCRLNSPLSMIWAIGETWCFCFIRGFASDGIGGHVAGVQAKGATVFSLYSESNVPLCMWSKEKQMSSGYPGLEIMHKCRYGTSFTSLKGTKVHSTATSKLIPRCTKLQVTTQSWLFIVYMSKALFIVWSSNCTNVRIFKPLARPPSSKVQSLTGNLQDLPWHKTGPSQ